MGKILSVVALLAVASAHAQWIDDQGNRVADTDDRKAIGSAFVVFSGCKPSVVGKCHVSMRFRVLRPDGKLYADTPSMEV